MGIFGRSFLLCCLKEFILSIPILRLRIRRLSLEKDGISIEILCIVYLAFIVFLQKIRFLYRFVIKIESELSYFCSDSLPQKTHSQYSLLKYNFALNSYFDFIFYPLFRGSQKKLSSFSFS